MKKLIIIRFLLICSILSPFLSCVDNDYNFNKVNEDIVFSPEGLYVPIGSLDTMFLVKMFVEDMDGERYVREYNNFFSETLYDYFVIDGKDGEDRAIGSISFESTLYYQIKNIDTQGELKIQTRALREDGSPTKIEFADQVFQFSNGVDQPFAFSIDQEDILDMKEASILEFTVVITTGGFVISDFDESDIIILKDMNLKSSGGVVL